MPDDSVMMLTAGNVADAALSGLLQPRKTLPAKLFYDEEGCRLFGRITELPEYYLTRTEHALLAEIEALIRAGLPDAKVKVTGDDGQHFEALVVSRAFEGKSRIERHRMVYAALGDRMRGQVHALSMRTLTPEEHRRVG